MSEVVVYCSRTQGHKSGEPVHVGTWRLTEVGHVGMKKWRPVPTRPKAGHASYLTRTTKLTPQEAKALAASATGQPLAGSLARAGVTPPYDRHTFGCRQCGKLIVWREETAQKNFTAWNTRHPGTPLDIAGP